MACIQWIWIVFQILRRVYWTFVCFCKFVHRIFFCFCLFHLMNGSICAPCLIMWESLPSIWHVFTERLRLLKCRVCFIVYFTVFMVEPICFGCSFVYEFGRWRSLLNLFVLWVFKQRLNICIERKNFFGLFGYFEIPFFEISRLFLSNFLLQLL